MSPHSLLVGSLARAGSHNIIRGRTYCVSTSPYQVMIINNPGPFPAQGRHLHPNTAASPIQVSSPIGPQVSQVQNAVFWLVQFHLAHKKTRQTRPAIITKDLVINLSIYSNSQLSGQVTRVIAACFCSAAVLHAALLHC